MQRAGLTKYLGGDMESKSSGDSCVFQAVSAYYK